MCTQISSLRQQLSAAAEHQTATVAELRHDHERELRELRAEMMTTAQHYEDKIQRLESLKRDEINAANEQHQQQLKVLLQQRQLLLLLLHCVSEKNGTFFYLL